jgi:HAD superfamily hydrolase (TIGR01509 family)
VIFDLDGVLVDSEIWWDEARAEYARIHGRPWTEDDRTAVMGQNSRQWSATMRSRLGIGPDEDEIERVIVGAVVDRYRREGAPLIAGADTVVRRVHRDLRTALASSAHRAVIDAAIDGLELRDAFDVVVSSDEVDRGKPEPDVFLAAARRLGVEPPRCLVVEDSRNGVLAGIAAGMTVALVPNASIPPAPGTREGASVVFERLSGILGLLDLPPDDRQIDPDAAAAHGGRGAP